MAVWIDRLFCSKDPDLISYGGPALVEMLTHSFDLIWFDFFCQTLKVVQEKWHGIFFAQKPTQDLLGILSLLNVLDIPRQQLLWNLKHANVYSWEKN